MACGIMLYSSHVSSLLFFCSFIPVLLLRAGKNPHTLRPVYDCVRRIQKVVLADAASAWTKASSQLGTEVPTAADGFTLTPSAHGGALRFGGQSYTFSAMYSRDDLYQFDGAIWTVLHPGSMTISASLPRVNISESSYAFHPPARSRHCALAVAGGLYVMYGLSRSGDGSTSTNFNDIWSFDLASLTWRFVSYTGPAAPPARDSMVCVLRGDTIFMHGGIDRATSAVLGDLWGFHIPTSTWQQVDVSLGLYPQMYGHTAVYLPAKDAILIHGGSTAFAVPSPISFSVFAFSFTSPPGSQAGLWAVLYVSGVMPARHYASSTLWEDRWCIYGGVMSVSTSVEQLSDDLLCLPVGDVTIPIGRTLASRDATVSGVQMFPLPASSPETSAQLRWKRWQAASGVTAGARQRHGFAFFQPSNASKLPASSVNATGRLRLLQLTANGSVDTGALVVVGGINAYGAVSSDVWLTWAPTYPAGWTDFSQNDLTVDLYLLTYLAYAATLTALTLACLVCMLRRTRLLLRSTLRAMEDRQRAPFPFIQEQHIHGTGVDAGIIAALPTVTFVCKKHRSSPAPENNDTQAALATTTGSANKWIGSLQSAVDMLPHERGRKDSDESVSDRSPRVFGGASPVQQPIHSFDPGDITSCTICLSEFTDGDELKVLPCLHWYHEACVSMWLVDHKLCPLCKGDVMAAAI